MLNLVFGIRTADKLTPITIVTVQKNCLHLDKIFCKSFWLYIILWLTGRNVTWATWAFLIHAIFSPRKVICWSTSKRLSRSESDNLGQKWRVRSKSDYPVALPLFRNDKIPWYKVSRYNYLFGLSKERPILGDHPKAHIHEIRRISCGFHLKSAGFRTDFTCWNPADFERPIARNGKPYVFNVIYTPFDSQIFLVDENIGLKSTEPWFWFLRFLILIF